MPNKKNKDIDFATIAALCDNDVTGLRPCNHLLRSNKLCSVSTSDEKECNYHSSNVQVEGEQNLKFTILRTLDDALNQVVEDKVLSHEEVIHEKKMLVKHGLRSTLAGTFDTLPEQFEDESSYTLLKALFYRLIVGEEYS